MSNLGAWPIDPATATGLFRFEVGDVVGTAHDPDDGKADFEFMSDATIDALIAAYPDSIDTAKAKALASMATQLIAAAQDIQVDDIKIKTVERANLMAQRAAALEASTNAADASSAFSVVALTPTGYYDTTSADRYYGPSGF
jgi:hypothetical protein